MAGETKRVLVRVFRFLFWDGLELGVIYGLTTDGPRCQIRRMFACAKPQLSGLLCSRGLFE
jgi:hypothetical protein